MLASSPVAEVSAGDPTAPVVVGDCLWGAWAGSPGAVVKACGGGAATPVGIDRDGSLSRPVFRINRGVAMLNDVSDGRIFDLELLKSLDNWQEVRQPDVTPTDQQPEVTQDIEDAKNKPKAGDDELGARPGRTTILHVLDNDTDPSGQVLSITAVTAPGNENATTAISPDGQSIRYTLSEGGGSSAFEYTLSNGVQTATGSVSVQARADSDNEPPTRRQGATPSLVVATGATLPVQVIADWRDFDGDPVTLAEIAALDQGSAITTPDGRIEYTAPGSGEGGTVQVGYSASDGRADPVSDAFEVEILPSSATAATAAVTQPDVVRGEAGKPVAIAPLMNDIQIGPDQPQGHAHAGRSDRCRRGRPGRHGPGYRPGGRDAGEGGDVLPHVLGGLRLGSDCRRCHPDRRGRGREQRSLAGRDAGLRGHSWSVCRRRRRARQRPRPGGFGAHRHLRQGRRPHPGAGGRGQGTVVADHADDRWVRP